MEQSRAKEISLQNLKKTVREYSVYLFSKTGWIIAVAIVFGIIGVLYAYSQRPLYTAEVTFAAESQSNTGFGAGYAGLASQFGFDMGGSSGIFEGDNIIELFKSRLLVEKTLLSEATIANQKILLVDYYINVNKLRPSFSRDPRLNNVSFKDYPLHTNRGVDSLLKSICNNIEKSSLAVSRPDKKLNILSATISDYDEVFAKYFLETLVANAVDFYVDYKIKKSKENVQILQRQADSLRRMVSGNIEQIAVSNDLNVNPAKQVVRTGVQRKQVDIQVNSAIYAEVAKNLELSKIALRKETPFILIIDTPKFPLDKKKLGRLFALVAFGFIGGVLATAFFFFRKLLEL